ncbi:MAG: ATP-dependent DNA helicase RecG [Deltaproteobacteria bacterium]|nr:ATP-dependent DNA helicase RecG [Deltaproteobacteria bacterium]
MTARLDTEVRYLKGVGPQIAERLAKKSILTIGDLLFHLPYRYLDRRQLSSMNQLTPGKDRTIVAEIITCGPAFIGRQRKKIFEIVLSDGTGRISAKWFHFPHYFISQYHKKMWVLLSGEASVYNREIQFIHPEVQILDADEAPFTEAPGIIPLYPLTEGIGQRTIRRILLAALEMSGDLVIDTLPESLRKKNRLLPLNEALHQIHNPEASLELQALNDCKTEGHRRLIFEEFFFVELGLALKRRGIKKEKGISFKVEGKLFDSFLSNLPFTLTAAQKKVLCEISKDMEAPQPMNRLVQGDVGSGKTVVSFAAAAIAIQNGAQVAIMAPTELLAEQHYLTAERLFTSIKLEPALLTGSTPKDERAVLLKRISRGDVPLLFGTHALLEEEVRFQKLGFIVIDEQHRFGVMQRALLKNKGGSPWPPCGQQGRPNGVLPDILVMTATPIPRTLAMTLYGDLDVSIIDELPAGRQPIETRVVAERDREKVYLVLEKTIARGEQGFIVYPLVEESEKLDLKDATQMAERLRERFPEIAIGLLHGRLSGDEKEAVMRDFKNKKISLLVATTVIEVGIDIPNATLMVIEHAERFGLAQLHQLRGRIGRGEKASRCLLMVGGARSEEGRRRLAVMEKTQDGFKIAEEDLAIRGPGEFLGTRQSGLPDFHLANLVRDLPILNVAREEAFSLIDKDPELRLPEHKLLKKGLATLAGWWQGKLELASVA